MHFADLLRGDCLVPCLHIQRLSRRSEGDSAADQRSQSRPEEQRTEAVRKKLMP